MRDDQIVLQFSTCQPETLLAKWLPVLFDPSFQLRVYGHSPFSHLDMVWDDEGNLLGSSDSPAAPIVETQPPGNPRGVALRIPLYQRFGIRRRATITTDPLVVRKFRAYAWAQMGKPFDHDALKVKVFLSPYFPHRNWRADDKWYCAEMYGRCTEESGLLDHPLIGIKDRVTAPDLLLILNCVIDSVEEFWLPIPGLPMCPGEHA